MFGGYRLWKAGFRSEIRIFLGGRAFFHTAMEQSPYCTESMQERARPKRLATPQARQTYKSSSSIVRLRLTTGRRENDSTHPGCNHLGGATNSGSPAKQCLSKAKSAGVCALLTVPGTKASLQERTSGDNERNGANETLDEPRAATAC